MERKFLLLIAVFTLALAACSTPPVEEPTATPLPEVPTEEEQLSPTLEAEDPPEFEIGTAVVDSVTLSQQGEQWIAGTAGNLPDGCTATAGSTQSVQGNTISITLNTARPADQMCTTALVPFNEEIVIDTSTLSSGQYTVEVNGVPADQPLILDSAAETSSAAGEEQVSQQSQLVNMVWQWSALVESDPAAQSVVADPENYTITFKQDGSASVKADCNIMQVTYTIDGDMLTLNMFGPSTLAFCGEDSLDTQYLSLLSGANQWRIEDSLLQLSTADDSIMTFENGGPAPGGVGIDPSQISLDTQGLPTSWQAVVIPAQPYDESQPPGPQGLPEHIQILFGVTEPADRQSTDPVMFIIPVQSYQAMYEANDNESVTNQIDRIAELTYVLPNPAPTAGYPALPPTPYSPVAGANDLAVQLGRADANENSASKNGFRFVGRWAQDANPVSNQNLFYTYQGYTNDGQYLVSFFYPVSTGQLPETTADVPAEQMDQFNADAQAAINEIALQLNDLETADWEPDLATLDALVGSLQIENMAASGLQNKTWQWTGTLDASGQESPVERSADYTVYFHEDGSFNFQADCNNGGGIYTFQGGFTGQISMQVGPMTRAACPEDSRSDEMVNNFFSIQDFKLLPGGLTLELELPAGGDTMVFQVAGSVDIDLPEPESGEPQGTIIAPDGANVRLGPGTNYPIVGYAPLGVTGEIIGISEDSLWWAVNAENSPSKVGWVLGELVAAENVEDVPVLPAPVVPQPTPVPTPVPPPSPSISFSAEPTTISAGECAVLSWNVENIQAVWVYPKGDNYQDYPVTGNGSQTVCPTSTTTYEMRVQHTDGTVEIRSVTIQVRPSNNLANTSWVVSSLYVNQIPTPGVSQSVYFGVNQDISVDGGCNTFNGTYTVDGATISIGPLAGTQKACGELIDSQEQNYLSALAAARTFAINGSQLIFYDGAGAEVLRFNFAG